MTKFRDKLIGGKDKFDLQHRVLNASMLLTTFLSLFAAISNYFLNLNQAAIFLGFSMSIVFLFLYVFSFYLYKYKLVSIIGLSLLVLVYLPLIWFTNEGSYGSTQYLTFLILTGLLTIIRGWIRIFLVGLLIVVAISLLIFEYYFPELLIPYPDRTNRYLDMIISFIFVITGVIFYINIYYKEYYNANSKLNKKNIILEKKQKEIIEQQRKIEKQKHELELKAHDLEEANKTKDRFFTIIAHDLKSPFNTLIAFSELIEHAIIDKDIDEIEKLNKLLQESSLKTHKLLLNLLDWSKAQTDKIEYHPEKIELDKTIKEHVELFKHQAESKKTKITVDMCNCEVYADRNMINTVLRNLISNAIKYTNNGEININSQCDDANCTLKITDTGVGISKENLSKLFVIDYYISTPGTNGERGTGLGLILCKEFIEKNNGTIGVESVVDKGSTFSIKLPINNT